ncbi:MAG: NAD-dependent epimerase/dehydratase family protein [Candidatus Marinarcus sp.]|uniref:NAD-dependent epimerase/dehydratase family protein n=1 Tax=Candidatus Marinarcus sp. TaxID=3100987 RepID=UPI003B004480
MIKNIVIGKNSNLSNHIYKQLSNCSLISSREIFNDVNILLEFKYENINIIFNNFQPAIELNSIENNSKYITNSILITSMILDYFKNTQINKLIYTSSSSVYGNNILCSEKDDLKPMNLHASLKVANEKLIENYCSKNNIDYTIARIFNMYGGDDNFSVISKIIKAYKTSQELTIANNGNAIRDFIHIDDVVNSYIRILEIRGLNIVNIGTGTGHSIKNILDFLENNKISIKTKNIYRDELKTSTANNRLLCEVVCIDSFTDIRTYLKKELDI